MPVLLTQSATAFISTLALTVILAKLAPKLNLVDKPGKRKKHTGDIPVIGGIAIYLSLVLGYLLWGENNSSLILENKKLSWVFMLSGGILVTIGALDDRWKLGVLIRLICEVLVAIIIIKSLDLNLLNLGALLGDAPIILSPVAAFPLTVLAIVGLINAFNMLDGIDGLLATLVLTILINFHIFTKISPGFVTIYIGSCLLAFLVCNMSLSAKAPRVFLGDAGSRLLGFVVVCLLLTGTSGQLGGHKVITPVTALYLSALPIFDMCFIVLRRVLRQASPFKPDRSHIHHLMQDMGFSDKKALVIILCLGTLISVIGLSLKTLGISEMFHFLFFVATFMAYCLFMNLAWLSVIKRQT